MMATNKGTIKTRQIMEKTKTLQQSTPKNTFFALTHINDSKIYTNLTGRFSVLSIASYWYIFICYVEDSNFILETYLKNRSDNSISTSYGNIIKTLRR